MHQSLRLCSALCSEQHWPFFWLQWPLCVVPVEIDAHLLMAANDEREAA